ncbi:MAG: malonyl-CoA decarboxylase [Alphaproteobacteria bacterium]|nr:malonyl-CoA decarboxylase [Alphaproteobacteria bacterium]
MSDPTSAGFFEGVFDRTLTNLRMAWREIAESARGVLAGAPRPELAAEDTDWLRQRMLSCLDGRGGEVTARARAADLGRTYLSLDPSGRERFLRLLASEFDVDRSEIDRCCSTLLGATHADQRAAAERALRIALEPPRISLLRRFNALPEGVKFLVDRRAELIDLGQNDPLLAGLEEDLKRLLGNWFDIGFLELKRITWESPAALLEKLMAYEAVHEIRGWTDLKNRLEADRRCFAFFHPRMPDEPLIFVEVALVSGMTAEIQPLLDEAAPIGDPHLADTAIFYSISNCQRGLAGISFGDFLIKRVVDALATELPRLKVFATLSPVPGFCAWLERQCRTAAGDLLLPAERSAIEALGEGVAEAELTGLIERYSDPRVVAALREPLLRLCAYYLVRERAPSGRALDPVAHFHLSNGARVERLNWLGDISPKGLQQSAGIMVNYLYRLGDIEANHEAYRGEGRVVASTQVRSLARIGREPRVT